VVAPDENSAITIIIVMPSRKLGITFQGKEIFTIYPKKRVSKAGSAVRQTLESPEDVDVIENWRASYNYVLKDGLDR
jgi:hypothetical protein